MDERTRQDELHIEWHLQIHQCAEHQEIDESHHQGFEEDGSFHIFYTYKIYVRDTHRTFVYGFRLHAHAGPVYHE